MSIFGKRDNKSGKHFTPNEGEKLPPQPKDQTAKRIDLPDGVREVVKFRFAEIVSCQEAMGVLASISGQKKRSLWDYIAKTTGIKMTNAQILFDEKEVPYIEMYT